MMYREVEMNSRVTIKTATGEQLVFPKISSFESDEGWSMLSPTATVQLPYLDQALKKQLNAGDSINVELGYDGILFEEFTGYIVDIDYSNPMVLSCEGESWLLKQKEINGGKGKSWSKVSLKDVLKYLVPEIEFTTIPDTILEPFTIRSDVKSVAEALTKLKDQYRLAIYYRDKKLFCGLAYTEPNLSKTIYHFQKNCVRGTLKWKDGEAVKIRVRAISFDAKNKKVEAIVGNSGGNTTTMHFQSGLTKEQLTEMANQELKKLKFDGYRGVFMAFGIPRPQHSSIIELHDDKYPERIKANRYFIDHIRKTYDSQGGFLRHITPGSKA